MIKAPTRITQFSKPYSYIVNDLILEGACWHGRYCSVCCSGISQFESRREQRLTWLRLFVAFKDPHSKTLSLPHIGQLRILSASLPRHCSLMFRYSTKPNLNYCQRLYVHKSNNITFHNCAVLGYYAANSGNFLLTFREYLSVLSLGSKMFGFLTL